MPRPYEHLSQREREIIALMLKQEYSLSAIARTLKRAVSTISREVHRNAQGGVYRFRRAHGLAEARRQKPRRPKKIVGRLRERVAKQLGRAWSPEQIAGRGNLQGQEPLCLMTIYRYLTTQEGQALRRYLRGPTKEKRANRERCARIHGQTMIHERPEEVETREVMGHWEGDTIQGKTKKNACLATLVERVSRYLSADLLSRCNAASLNASVCQWADEGYEIKSLTVDNGMEFASHAKLQAQTDIPIYFAEKKKPWQRGTNENTNGLLRWYFPKRTDFSTISPAQLRWAVEELNNRPRKSLGYKTPKEVMAEQGFALVK